MRFLPTLLLERAARWQRLHRSLTAVAMGLGMLALARAEEAPAPPVTVAKPAPSGAKIYEKMCADCHGKNGEGVADQYAEALKGSRSLKALTKRIARTMPDDDVGSCVGTDAQEVAQYIYSAFYSSEAQARIHPPRIDLARLTVEQYRTSVMDLIGQFRFGSDDPIGAERGLKAHYSGLLIEKPEPEPPPGPAALPPAGGATPPAVVPGANPAQPGHPPQGVPQAKPLPTPAPQKKVEKKKDRPRVSFDRKDDAVSFNFGEASPAPPEKEMDAHDFMVQWNGSIIADETGMYEFIIATENGVRLWVNDLKDLLIDASISDGKPHEEKKSIYLIAGRAYPLRLELSKSKEKTASIQFRWKPPHGAVCIVPNRSLLPRSYRERMIVSTEFPADDRSMGFERGTAISKEWDAATTDAALSVAEYVSANLEELSGAKLRAPDRVEKLKSFSHRFMEAAFRRPLSEEYIQLIEKQFSVAKTPELAVKRVVLFALKSPRFLYPAFPGDQEHDGYDTAAQLALTLWDSLPDKRLLQAAASGRLKTREDIATQAERMVADARAKPKLAGFFSQWLDMERAEAAQKDPKVFPQYNEETQADLRTSLKLFLDQVVWSGTSDYRELLRANYLYLNDRLGKLYGKHVDGSAFQRVEFDPKERAGVLTHPYLLAGLASSSYTSPIHRGVFLTRNIVGLGMKPPPMAVSFEDSKFDPTLTMREKITQLTKSASCMRCHSTINALGFALESYDAIGRWRTEDNHKPVNSASAFTNDDDDLVRLSGARDIADYAAESPSGQRAFVQSLFRHCVKQPEGAFGSDTLADLCKKFAASGFNIKKLLVEIATVAASRDLPSISNKVAQAASASVNASAP